MTWQAMQTPCGGWQWSTDYFPNGWSAVVSDDSQISAPRQITRYRASACCRWWITSCDRTFTTFAEAKKAAIDLAIRQLTASNNPNCIVADRVEAKTSK